MTREFEALSASITRLRDDVGRMVPDDLTVSAFPTEWTVADTLSHIGSGAVISLGRIDEAIAGRQLARDTMLAIWDVWNSKPPQEQAADALLADEAFRERLSELTHEDKAAVRVEVGSNALDFETFVRGRVSEHAVHRWDIAVAFDPSAVVEQDSVEVIIDNLVGTARWSGKPDGSARSITVRTVDPVRGFVITTDAEAVTLSATDPSDDATLQLPAEAFVRLVFGRLPADLTPATAGPADCLADLRTVFRGV